LRCRLAPRFASRRRRCRGAAGPAASAEPSGRRYLRSVVTSESGGRCRWGAACSLRDHLRLAAIGKGAAGQFEVLVTPVIVTATVFGRRGDFPVADEAN